MRGDEQRVIDAYVAWLERNNWTVRREADFVDVYAVRGDERLYAEAKGPDHVSRAWTLTLCTGSCSGAWETLSRMPGTPLWYPQRH